MNDILFNAKMKYFLRNTKILFLCSICFFFGSMITLNLLQENNCIAKKVEDENSSEKYYKSPKYKHPYLIILVMSAPENLERRSVIRETWLKLKDNENKEIVKHYFVVGSLGLSVDLMLQINTEQFKFDDLLILTMKDTYHDLSYKVLQSFVWLNEQTNYGLNFKFILKCDDDSFVRANILQKEIKNLEERNSKNILNSNSKQSVHLQTNIFSIEDPHVYWGYFNGNAKIKTQGKWKETNWILSNTYLPYAQGGGYILSNELVKYLAKNSNNLFLYSSEDVSVGTWLAPVKNIVRIHDIRFDTEWNSRGCLNSHLIFHNIAIDEMRKMYSNIKNQRKPCINEIVKRNAYMYNWDETPSKCCIRL